MAVLRKRRRTKIVCTLGPACAGEILPRLLEAGMDVARLNFSHGTGAEHAQWIRRLRRLAEQRGQPLAILQDLAGPKIRIGELSQGQVELVKDQAFVLSAAPGPGDRNGVSVAAYPELVGEAPLGAHIYLQDGEIDLVVEDKSAQALRCRVAVGGRLRSHVGVNLPGHTVSVPSLTPKDREDLRLGVELGVDFIALSYVRRAQDVNEARELLTSLGTEIPIIAKIEKHEAVKNLEEILDTADGLMVARGDLGVEVSLERVPLIQKQVIAAANRAGKPVITATQMLLSMVSHSRPSRAEAADAANAILDGTDAVMLSEETATGQFPVEAVKFLDRLAQIMEEAFPYTEWLRARAPERRPNISDAISYAACEMARDLEAAAILTSTAFGTTARFISRFRPRAPIIGVTPRPETWRRLCLSWGVFPLMAQDLTDTDHMIQAVKEEALKAGWLKPGQRVVITAGSPMGLKGTTNMIKADVI